MSRRAPRVREVMEEGSVVVHGAVDRVEAHRLVLNEYLGVEQPARPDDLPEGFRHPEDGEVVCLRTRPASRWDDVAYWYQDDWPGQRGSFMAVVFSSEPEHARWWRGLCRQVGCARYHRYGCANPGHRDRGLVGAS